MTNRNEIDYCREECYIRTLCEKDNPELCRIYKNYVRINNAMESFSFEDRKTIINNSKSHLDGIREMNELKQELLGSRTK